MYIYLKFYSNYFKQQIQQGNSGEIKILKRLKVGRCNVGLYCNKGKLGKDKQNNSGRGDNSEGDNNNNYSNGSDDGGGNNIGKDNNKGKWGREDREVRL